MIILMEGCDCTGKTHIAVALSHASRYPYFKYQGVKEDNIKSEERINIHEKEELYSIALLETLEPNLIIDRHYVGDYAYGRLYRNHPVERIRKVDEAFARIRNHLIVICHKPALTVKTEDFIPSEDYKYINDAYIDFYENFTKTNCILLDTTSENLPMQIAKIMQCTNDVMTGQFKKERL